VGRPNVKPCQLCTCVARRNVSMSRAYLAAAPVDDARFIAVFAHSLEHTGGHSPEEARRVGKTLLPDIMCFDYRRPASYPNNGRTLTDDVLDHFLSILTNGKVTTDGIGPHNDLLADFPYLGPPHRHAKQDVLQAGPAVIRRIAQSPERHRPPLRPRWR
jgi:hypothetical protein